MEASHLGTLGFDGRRWWANRLRAGVGGLLVSYVGDKARELRHSQGGGKRITARISGEAYEALYQLADHYRMPACAVLERLLLGSKDQASFGFSPDEMRLLERGDF